MENGVLKLIRFIQFSERDSTLSIFSSEDKVPFVIKRVFTVDAKEACSRGCHAHKQCMQLMIALRGECSVVCDDGKERKTYLLNDPSQGLLVPPTIWAEQVYQKDSLLMILTDQYYDPEDYIRDYQQFLHFRAMI